jgi:protein DJ-1
VKSIGVETDQHATYVESLYSSARLNTPSYSLSRGIKIVPDSTSLPATASSDVLILPGGAKGAETFCKNKEVQQLIRVYRDAGKLTAFICAATTALVASVNHAGKTEGLASTTGARVTSHPSVKDQIVHAGWDYASDAERVVVDGKVVTSRGPGTAMAFALKIVELLAGQQKRDEISGPMVLAKEL